MKKAVKYLIVIFLFFIISADTCRSVAIEVVGDWSETIDVTDLQSGPGSDIVSNHESASNVGVVDITGTTSNWDVDVKKTDSNWHANFTLNVRRTSDGSGAGSISGGTSYQEITDTDASFFSGYRSRSNVNLQLQLTGASVQITPDTYTTTISYTITET